jgi:hypothetical protein
MLHLLPKLLERTIPMKVRAVIDIVTFKAFFLSLRERESHFFTQLF